MACSLKSSYMYKKMVILGGNKLTQKGMQLIAES